jgi:triosephosphate isomerase
MRIIIGNWKLNHTKKTTLDFLDEFLPQIKNIDNIHIAIAPVSTLLDAAYSRIQGRNLFLAAQNVFYEDFGSFTGEYSCKNLLDFGVAYCLIGHSERRQLFHEIDSDVNKKVLACLANNITPVICIGESFQDRNCGRTSEILSKQCANALKNVNSPNIIIAYEPIWAIGTGEVASEDKIIEAMAIIRQNLSKIFTKEVLKKIRLLYGGSVNNQNIKDLMQKCDIDGVLVGGASLQVASFFNMVKTMSLLGV